MDNSAEASVFRIRTSLNILDKFDIKKLNINISHKKLNFNLNSEKKINRLKRSKNNQYLCSI